MILYVMNLMAILAPPSQGEAACNAGPAQVLVGRKLEAGIESDAMKLSGAKTVRTLKPGTAVTMEYRPDRLNVHVDKAGKIGRVNCS
jgi:hypothetical protein